jgi:DNA-binding response OmpR family regulator
MQTILVIDDDELTLNLIETLLEEGGFKVLSTADGPQGIAIYKQRHPDLVLLDLGLPSMNGLEVLRRIRGYDDRAKVVVVTGYGTDESAEVAQLYGAADFLRKPLEYSTFVEKIKAAVRM